MSRAHRFLCPENLELERRRYTAASGDDGVRLRAIRDCRVSGSEDPVLGFGA